MGREGLSFVRVLKEQSVGKPIISYHLKQQ